MGAQHRALSQALWTPLRLLVVPPRITHCPIGSASSRSRPHRQRIVSCDGGPPMASGGGPPMASGGGACDRTNYACDRVDGLPGFEEAAARIQAAQAAWNERKRVGPRHDEVAGVSCGTLW